MTHDIHIQSIKELFSLPGKLQSSSGNWTILLEQVRNESTSIKSEANDIVDSAQQVLGDAQQRVENIKDELYSLYEELNHADEEHQSDVEARIADVENQLSDAEYQAEQIQEKVILLVSLKDDIITASSVLDAQLVSFTAKMNDINEKASSALVGYLHGVENIINKTRF